MNIPFTAEQFLEIFEKYNLAIWPMQVIAYLLSIAAVLLAIKKIRYSDRIISAVLSCYWVWMGQPHSALGTVPSATLFTDLLTNLVQVWLKADRAMPHPLGICCHII